MQSNNHNPVCDFSGEIVSYLYDEIGPPEKTAFETHLARCRTCAGELAAFSEVHTALGDWRENVFAPLETPEIKIPYDRVRDRIAVTGAPAQSWLDRFRAGFGFSFAWPAAASILLLACAAALFFSFSTAHQNEIAAGNSPQPVPEQLIAAPETTGPQVEITDAPSFLPPEVKSPARSANSSNVRETKAIAVRQSVVNRQTPTVRNIDLPVRNVPSVRIKQPSETVAVNQRKGIKSAALLGDDEDSKDDSLRLSELFDENDEEN